MNNIHDMLDGQNRAVTAERVFCDVRRVIAEMTDTDEVNISPDARLSDIGITSLTLIDIREHLEERYRVNIPDACTDDFRTMTDLVEYLLNRFHRLDPLPLLILMDELVPTA